MSIGKPTILYSHQKGNPISDWIIFTDSINSFLFDLKLTYILSIHFIFSSFSLILMFRFGPFFVHPVVAGLDDGKPILVEYDAIGTQSSSENFAVGGTAGENMLGLMEAHYKPNMSAQQIEDTLTEIITCGIDRDILSGYGAVVYVLTVDEMKVLHLKTKML
jgi:20S proteasome subunit beta 3